MKLGLTKEERKLVDEIFDEEYKNILIDTVDKHLDKALGLEAIDGIILKNPTSSFNEKTFQDALSILHEDYRNVGMEFILFNSKWQFFKQTLFSMKHRFSIKETLSILLGNKKYFTTSNLENRAYLFTFLLTDVPDEKVESVIAGYLYLYLRCLYRLDYNEGRWTKYRSELDIVKDAINFSLRMHKKYHDTYHNNKSKEKTEG